MDRFTLLNLLVILTINNLVSMYIYELFIRMEKLPLVVRAIGWLTAVIAVIIGTVFLMEFVGIIKETYIEAKAMYGF